MRATSAQRASTPRRVPGSRPPLPPGATREPWSEPDAPLELTLRLRRAASGLERHLATMHERRRGALTHEEYERRFANPAALDVVERWARREGFEVVGGDPVHRSVEIRGAAGKLARRFGVELVRVRWAGASWMSHTGRVHLPPALAAAVAGVVGFHQQPLAGRGAIPEASATGGADPATPGPTFTAPEIAALYRFPEGDGRGVTVGVVALGGGYRRRDLDVYFETLGLPRPRFTAVSVHGARNAPRGRTKQFDGEVTGDIETVGGLAPGAHVVVYFAPNTERGFLGAVARAVHDRIHRPSVLSISWGRDERHWTRSTLRRFDEVLAEAAALGITVCCSSGDDGAYAQPGERRASVCFPASSAHVLACGGTSLVGTTRSRLNECCWRDAQGASGGGVSELIARPPWQTTPLVSRASGRHKGRCLPDVAANGDPESGYRVYVAGGWHVGAGTSAAAPLWAGLVARIQQRTGRRVGLFTPRLYRELASLLGAGALRAVRTIEGTSAEARRGWNRHTGLGVPGGTELAAALAAAIAAATPRRRPNARKEKSA